MNPLLASVALGVVAAWPASGLGWLIGAAADRLTGDPLARARAWNKAVALPPAVLGLTVAISALPREAADPVYQAALAAPIVARAGTAIGEASARASASLGNVEAAAALLVLGALGGLAVAGVRQAMGQTRLRRIVAQARPVSHDLTLAVRAAARRLDTGRPEVRVSDEIDQPLLAGLANPVILLPAALVARLNVQSLMPICAHELAHLKRGDNWRLLVEHLLGGLFWIAPPYAALRARAGAVREELADALALDGAAVEARRTYAEILIDVLRTRAAPTPHTAFTGKGQRPTLMRLKAITDPRDPATFARKALLGLIGLLAVAAAATGSIALARQDGLGRNGSRTVITDSDSGQYVEIQADRIRVTNTEVVDGKPQIKPGQSATYHGDVQVRGQLKAPQTLVLLNGKPPPAGFDPTVLPRGAIQALEVTGYPGGKPSVVLNVIM